MRKRRNDRIFSCLALLMGFGALLFAGCNSNSKEYEDLEMYNSSTAINGFSLKPNAKVMANLDSVHFAIDLKNAVIFNADSLPVGTDVTKLVPVISLPTQLQSAVIDMRGGEVRVGQVNYLKNPTDSIDFTGDVTLRLVASDGTMRNYDLKVNVHKMNPDSIVWTSNSGSLPLRMKSPKNQKTVNAGGVTTCLTEESDGTFTLATTTVATLDEWNKRAVTLPQGADVRSFSATPDAYYLLAGDSLYKSADGMNWEVVESGWLRLLGATGESVVGITLQDGQKYYNQYPRGSFAPYPMDGDFPYEGGSNLVNFSNKWSVDPISFFVGGRTADGLQATVWGFDGTTWTQMSSTPPPALEGACIVPYYVYMKTSSLWIQTEISAYILYGGKKSDGSVNRDVYVTYDTGVNWHKAPQVMQLPEGIAMGSDMDFVVSASPMSGMLDATWDGRSFAATKVSRIKYIVEGYQVRWECPYIYLFGGKDANGALNTDIRKGVLSRLTFIPVI